MSILVTYQSVFDAPAQALVVAVNCVGAMGEGVAEICKHRYPNIYINYFQRCKGGKVKPGRISVEDCYRLPDGRYIILFPTKNHWRADSDIRWIETGLADLLGHCCRLSLDTVALPPPGCGNGGRDFEREIRPMIEEMFSDEDVEVTVCI